MRERDDLLAEVKRLREDLKVQREMHAVCLEIHTESESCLQAEEKLTALRQSHARLLAAARYFQAAFADPSTYVQDSELEATRTHNAAVAEAEAL